MSKIARRVVGQATRDIPFILVGIGLVATLVWVVTALTVAVEQTWRVLSTI